MPLIATVFLASLLGSLHCAGMCGAFVLFAVGGLEGSGSGGAGAKPARSKLPLHAAYHGGRLITYTALGAIAGVLGSAFDFGGSLVGVQRAAAIGAGAMMVGFATIALLRIHGVRVPKPPLPRAWERVLTAGHRLAAARPPVVRALATGLLTTLLPCGWLYAFVITAAGTGSPILGALTMVVFWCGTLPILVALGTGLRAISGALGRRLPTLTATAVLVVGLATIVGRAGMLAPTSLDPDDPALCASNTTLPVAQTSSVQP